MVVEFAVEAQHALESQSFQLQTWQGDKNPSFDDGNGKSHAARE
jgi:hypothetical protein